MGETTGEATRPRSTRRVWAVRELIVLAAVALVAGAEHARARRPAMAEALA